MHFSKRGQSALEYLMTYGWALVGIVIAVAALVVLINPSTIQGDQCDAKFGAFTVSQSDVTGTSTQLVLVNQTGQSVGFNDVTIAGTHNGSASFTSGTVTLSGGGTTLNANETDTLIITPTNPLQGQYSLTYTLDYNAGQLDNVNAVGNCRGTI